MTITCVGTSRVVIILHTSQEVFECIALEIINFFLGVHLYQHAGRTRNFPPRKEYLENIWKL